MIRKFRKFLIQLGKVLPFVICGVIFLCYTECLIALLNNSFVLYGDSIVVNMPMNFSIASKVQYDIFVLFVILIISIAVETCYWNKLAILYLLINLVEKHYFSTIELCEETIYAIVVVNLLVSGFFVWKGVTILIKK